MIDAALLIAVIGTVTIAAIVDAAALLTWISSRWR
jgi:hypothetical protein